MDTEIANLRTALEVNEQRLASINRIAERQKALSGRGVGSVAELDEVALRASEIRARQAEIKAELDFALLRDRAAESGTFIMADGGAPDWLRFGELELTLEKRRAQHDLHTAEDALEEAQRDLAKELKVLERLQAATVTAPAGSLITSVLVSPGATVNAGDRLLHWVDCAALLVDVPISDAELPLITPGMAAEVVLEGEPTARNATVHLTRGSSATLGSTDLVAVAKGRTQGVAQVILTLAATPDEFDRCPIGRAAFVEFPGIGLIDVLRARLRL